MSADTSSEARAHIRVVSAANEAYAVGLAAMVASVLAAAAAPASIAFLVLDCGLSAATRRNLTALACRCGATIRFFAVDLSALGNVDTTGHGGAAAYARLLSPVILADRHGTIIYLDADLIVMRDLGALLDQAVGDAQPWAWAVPEVGVPFVSSPTGVFDWKEQGMAPAARYFNSGVLVFDLDVWRRERVADRALAYLRTHGAKVAWWDQGGLNVALYGHWRALDVRWNQTHAILASEATWLDAGFPPGTMESAKADPFIVHFSGSVKPWQHGCTDPRAPRFFGALSGTPWARVTPRTPWRQTGPGRLLRQTYHAAHALFARLRPLGGLLAQVVPARRRAVRQAQAQQRGFEALMRALLSDLRVRSGPFAGMAYVPMASWGHLGPLLTGGYEAELHETLERLLARGYRTVIDIGCAEGYYAVGLARRLPGATIHGFDVDAAALSLCRTMAELNGVGERVRLHDACTPETLSELLQGGGLVIADCEGHELELLDPRRAPNLALADMIVELHDFIDPTISSRLCARFAATHQITIVDVAPRNPRDYPALDGWPPSAQAMVLDERRPILPKPMQWAVLLAQRATA